MNLSDKIKRHVDPLEHAGVLGLTFDRRKKALCPWHEDTHPSLSYHAKSKTFKCFSCGHSGSVIDLHMQVKSMDFTEAIGDLARIYGIQSDDMPRKTKKPRTTAKKSDTAPSIEPKDAKPSSDKATPATPVAKPKEPSKEELTEVYEYFLSLCRFPIDPALSYLTGPRRMFTIDAIRSLRIVEIVDYQTTNKAMKERFAADLLKASGLFNDRGNLIFWHHTIIFPYLDRQGQVEYMRARYFWDGSPDPPQKDTPKIIGLTGRGIDHLYNRYTFTMSNEDAPVWIVEGEPDAVAMQSAGYNAVGLPGLQSWKKEMVADFKGRRVMLMLDNPKPGKNREDTQRELRSLKNVTDKIATDFDENNMTVHIVHLPLDVKDVTDYIATIIKEKGDAYEE